MDSDVFDDLNQRLKYLQDQITRIVMAEQNRRRSGNSHMEFLVKKHNQIAIRMDANKNHQRPHVHLDYGGQHHVASYAIDNGECLAGNDSLCGKAVSAWIADNRELLEKLWEITRTSPQPDDLVGQLKASKFWL